MKLVGIGKMDLKWVLLAWFDKSNDDDEWLRFYATSTFQSMGVEFLRAQHTAVFPCDTTEILWANLFCFKT